MKASKQASKRANKRPRADVIFALPQPLTPYSKASSENLCFVTGILLSPFSLGTSVIPELPSQFFFVVHPHHPVPVTLFCKWKSIDICLLIMERT